MREEADKWKRGRNRYESRKSRDSVGKYRRGKGEEFVREQMVV